MNIGITGIIFFISSSFAICGFICFSITLKRSYDANLITYRALIKLNFYNVILFPLFVTIGFFCFILLQIPVTWTDVIFYNIIWLLGAVIIFYESHLRERARAWVAIPFLLELFLPVLITIDLLHYPSPQIFTLPTIIALIIFIAPLTEFMGYLCELSDTGGNHTIQGKGGFIGFEILFIGINLLIGALMSSVPFSIFAFLLAVGLNLAPFGLYLMVTSGYGINPRNEKYLPPSIYSKSKTYLQSLIYSNNLLRKEYLRNDFYEINFYRSNDSVDLLKKQSEEETTLYSIQIFPKANINHEPPSFSTSVDGKNNFVGSCSVCRMAISDSEENIHCPFCNAIAHKSHLLEWLKIKGYCPICNTHFNRINIAH